MWKKWPWPDCRCCSEIGLEGPEKATVISVGVRAVNRTRSLPIKKVCYNWDCEDQCVM